MINKFCSAYIFAQLLILSATTAYSANRLCSEEWLKYEPTTVNLVGVIISEKFYGPPGFGEDKKVDILETAYLLRLSSGINVAADDQDQINNQTYKCEAIVQVVVPEGFSAQLVGKKVKVTGTLFESHTGHHWTNVLVSAATITPVP